MRAAAGTDADQVGGSRAFLEPGRKVILEEHKRGLYLAEHQIRRKQILGGLTHEYQIAA